jgi:hypothetical protein
VTAGSSSAKGQQTGVSEFCLTRSRHRFTAHFQPLLLPFAYAGHHAADVAPDSASETGQDRCYVPRNQRTPLLTAATLKGMNIASECAGARQDQIGIQSDEIDTDDGHGGFQRIVAGVGGLR